MTAERASGQQAMGSASSTEEEIIELTDEIPASQDDDIIELEDEVVSEQDDIIELENEIVVDSADTSKAEGGFEVPDRPIGPPDEADDDAAASSAEFADSSIQIADIIEDDLDEEVHHDDFVDSLGMDLETNAAIDHMPDDTAAESEPPPSTEHLSEPVSSEQIEAAVERVLLRILPERIDVILREAVERTLTREIERIKGLLLED